jgi:hypothetical protein
MILSSGEIVAVPEPGTIAGGGLLIALLAYRERKAFGKILRRLTGRCVTRTSYS